MGGSADLRKILTSSHPNILKYTIPLTSPYSHSIVEGGFELMS
jgi:hypothetical protein